MARDIDEISNDLANLYMDNSFLKEYPGTHIVNVTGKLVDSVFKSADSGEDRGDFAKGREQMAMHAIALLVGAKDWKQIERILFGDSNGD